MTDKGKHKATYLRRSSCHREDVQPDEENIQLGTSVLEEFAVMNRKVAQRGEAHAAAGAQRRTAGLNS